MTGEPLPDCAAARAAAPPGRIAGLDVWRALLMLCGLPRHAADWHLGLPLFDAICWLSASFRMGVFFGISGLLTGYALLCRPAGAWLTRRSVQLAIPLLFGLATLGPFVSLLSAWARAADGAPFRVELDWYHLWFLVALLLYAPLAVWLHALDAQAGVFARCAVRGWSGRRALLSVGMPVVVGIVVTHAIVVRIAPPGWWSALSQWRWIVGYAPLFVFGFALSRAPMLHDRVARGVAPLLVVALVGGVTLWIALGRGGDPALVRLAEPVLFFLSTGFGPVALLLVALRTTRRIRRVPAIVQRLSDASFTIYMLHLPIIAAVGVALHGAGWSPYLRFAVEMAAGGLLSLAIHEGVVRRSPFAAFVLNGRLPEARGRGVGALSRR